MAVHRLRQDAAATARLVTTLPVAHVVRLLKGVLKGVLGRTNKGAGPAEGGDSTLASASSLKASILRRVLISRIYGPDDLLAVLDELEATMPFEKLHSAYECVQERDASSAEGHGKDNVDGGGVASSASPSVVIFTEIDHHFKWMRVQGHDGHLYELYGQMMRRLRALAAVPLTGEAAPTGALDRPLVLVLNSTMTRRQDTEPDAAITGDGGIPAGIDDQTMSPPGVAIDGQDLNYRLALAALQQGRHRG